MNHNDNKIPHILILGGGFAGLSAAKALSKSPVKITLVDRENHHLFQPLLYQVATAGLSEAEIAQPIRHILSDQKNLTTVLNEVDKIDLPSNVVSLKDREISYDYLIIALGLKTSYFGNDNWGKYAPGLKNLFEAQEIRKKVLNAFEFAETSTKSVDLDFVVVGGGPTGVELAGAIAELSNFVMKDEFRNIDPASAKIHLIEAGERILPAFNPKQSEYAKKYLESLGVKVHLNTMVEDVKENLVVTKDLNFETDLIFWAAGLESGRAAKSIEKVAKDRAGRILVEKDLSVPQYKNVFVVGDLASASDKNKKNIPGVAPAALQMGNYVGKQIIRDLKNHDRKQFKYLDKGNMATIGRSGAVASFKSLRINGFLAWLMWLFVHLIFLFDMRNRITVLTHWVWSYFTWKRGARIFSQKTNVQ
jgi:NADH dehydrogenase